MDEDELLDAYHGAHPYSYGGQQRVQDFVNIDDGELKTVLSKSDIYTGYKELKKKQNFHLLLEPMATIIFGKQI